jgi:hypothetical protein
MRRYRASKDDVQNRLVKVSPLTLCLHFLRLQRPHTLFRESLIPMFSMNRCVIEAPFVQLVFILYAIHLSSFHRSVRFPP